jgi:hypothetical protein
MAKKTRASFQKRHKEQARQQKQRDKAARRLAAKQRRANAASEIGDPTLDMADVRLGPQSLPAPGNGVSDRE